MTRIGKRLPFDSADAEGKGKVNMNGWKRKWRAMKLIAKFSPKTQTAFPPPSRLKWQLLELRTQVGVVKGQSSVHRQSENSAPRPLTSNSSNLNPPQVAGVYVCQPCRSHIKWVYFPAPEKAPKHALKLLSCEAMWPSIKVVYGQDYPEDVYHEKGASCSGFGLGKHQLNRIVHGIYNVQTLLLIKANSFMNI